MVRRALRRQTRWYRNRCSTFKNKDCIVEKPFWKILEFWPLETSILTWAKKWLKWFQNDFSRAFERCLLFFSTATRSRDHGGGAFKRPPPPPPPSRRWKIQRPSRARVNNINTIWSFLISSKRSNPSFLKIGLVWVSLVCESIISNSTLLYLIYFVCVRRVCIAEKYSFFWKFGGQNHKISKIRDTHVVDLHISYLSCFLQFHLKMRFWCTLKHLPLFDPKSREMTSQK